MRPSAAFLTAALAATLLPVAAGAAELRLVTEISFFSKAQEADSVFLTGGGSCDASTCSSLTTGLDTGTISHIVTYDRPDPTPDTQSEYTGLAGGTVAYGYISGNLAGTINTTQGNGDQYGSRIVTGFRDEVTILPVDPALIGTPGTLTASLLMEQQMSASADAAAATPNELFAATTQWVLQGPDGNLANAFLIDTDDEAPNEGFSVIGSQPVTSIPPSFIVPYQVTFTFGQPFDLWMELQAEAFGGGSSSPENEEWIAASGMNFLHTISWQGIGGVLDGGGNPVGYSLDATSGTDWTQPVVAPVPAPGAFGLLATALAGVWLRRRR